MRAWVIKFENKFATGLIKESDRYSGRIAEAKIFYDYKEARDDLFEGERVVPIKIEIDLTTAKDGEGPINE